MSYRFAATLMVLWSGIGLASVDTAPGEPGISGQLVKYEGGDGVVLTADNIDWAGYTSVQLEAGTVNFREHWRRDQKRLNDYVVTEADAERIKADMSELLGKVLARALSDSEAFTLVSEGGQGVLRFTPRIEKLDIYNPGTQKDFVGHVLTDSQGDMVLVMDVSDSVSGELLASAIRHMVDPERGYMEETSSGSNTLAFRRMMERWSIWLLAMLEHVAEGPPGS